jgi:hypothetical protein
LAYTNAGYMSPAFDPLADVKVLLVSLAEDFRELRPTDESSLHFRNMIYNIFKSLTIDWTTGWDAYDDPALAEQITEYVENVEEVSPLFKEWIPHCMDILQSLILLPLTPTCEPDLRRMRKYYCIFVAEFIHLERCTGHPFYSLYLLHRLVEHARSLRSDYLQDATRPDAIAAFHHLLQLELSQINCPLPPDLRSEVLFCAMFAFAEQVESYLYYNLERLMAHKRQEYEQIDPRVRSVGQLMSALDVNFPDAYQCTDRTRIHVYNAMDRTHRELVLTPEQCVCMNQCSDAETKAKWASQWVGEQGVVESSSSSAWQARQSACEAVSVT